MAARILVTVLVVSLFAIRAEAQSFSGSINASAAYVAASPFYDAYQVTLQCSGTPCTGTYRRTLVGKGCSTQFVHEGPVVVNIDWTAPPGPIRLDIYVTDYAFNLSSSPSCAGVVSPGFNPSILPIEGTWDGTSGTMHFAFANVTPADFPGTFTTVPPPRPTVFPMTVTSSIGAVTSTASANIQFRPQDVGTTGSIYVFAVAPSTRVVNAAKDTSVQCVLAQLNSSGQLQAVSASNLQAYVTGVLSGQGQAVTILNGVATANIAGTTFYIGYGTSASAMLAAGINQRALAVSGDVACDPRPPATGWWWSPGQDGRGYSIEVAGNHIFFASYVYDVTGRATWLVASGNTSLDGTLFTGNLERYSQGQTLSSAYRSPTAAANAGAITLAFSDSSHGTLIWPGGTVAIERFNIVPDGVTSAPRLGQPQSGWWWNPAESGRGFFLEWQGGQLFMAGYMYDDAGEPIWYLATNTTTNLQAFSANWWQYANAQRINANVAPVTIQFQGFDNAILTLPGGRTTAIRRFGF